MAQYHHLLLLPESRSKFRSHYTNLIWLTINSFFQCHYIMSECKLPWVYSFDFYFQNTSNWCNYMIKLKQNNFIRYRYILYINQYINNVIMYDQIIYVACHGYLIMCSLIMSLQCRIFCDNYQMNDNYSFYYKMQTQHENFSM